MADEKIIPETSGGGEPEEVGFLASVINEIIYSPLNLVLVAIITILVYKIFRSRQQPAAAPPPEPELPRLRKDFTVAELRAFDGNQPDGRVLVAVNGTVYDVTKGKRFYGPGESLLRVFFSLLFLGFILVQGRCCCCWFASSAATDWASSSIFRVCWTVIVGSVA